MIRPTKELLARQARRRAPCAARSCAFIAAGIADGTLTDAQVAAFAMAVFFRGLDAERAAGVHAGHARLGHGAGLVGHRPARCSTSTRPAGVGDKVSLLLAPIVAACGGAVPMISGRGLGHTGGTLDKLDAIPGYDTTPDAALMRRGRARGGLRHRRPDRRPRARPTAGSTRIRDATGTVEAIPLIVSSILSKKLAAGLGALVMDVKHGSGAFMPELDDARGRWRARSSTSRSRPGCRRVALLTDMDQVLGRTAGNALEVRESIDALHRPARPPTRGWSRSRWR